MIKGRPKFGMDMDGLEADTYGKYNSPNSFVPWFNRKYGTKFTVRDYYEPGDGLSKFGIPYHDWVAEFSHFINEVGYTGLSHMQGAREGIIRLASMAEIIRITGRNKDYLSHTSSWVEKHIPEVNGKIRFSLNYFHPREGLPTKAKICREEGVVLMIEDEVKHAMQCAEEGISTILFHPDNYGYKLHPLITVVWDWEEIVYTAEKLMI